MKSIFKLATPKNFNFWKTVYSHGWWNLPPFFVKKETQNLKRVLLLSSGKGVVCTISESRKNSLDIKVDSLHSLSKQEKAEVRKQIATCLRFDEDLSSFYEQAKTHKNFRWVIKLGAGRLLRAPTVFEDVVKMICTTNCNWNLTQIMVNNLTSMLGKKVHKGYSTFPTPDKLASVSEKFLRKKIRTGYRAPYLLELARRIVKGDLDLESWRSSDLPTKELFKEVRSVKGIGPYAAGNILKLLGRYDYLGLDSWCRQKFYEIHKYGRKVSDRTIEKFYEPYGTWKGLFFWLDVTKDWYDHQFPF